MNPRILFTERQRMKQWWLWLILLGTNGLFLFGVARQVIGGIPFGSKPMNNGGLLIVTMLTLLLSLMFFNIRLDTQVKDDGIYVRFFPFHMKFRRYGWEGVEKSYLRQYAALKEYGGWGVRTGMGGAGEAYTVSGKQGLQLEFKDGKKLLIGTNKPEELEQMLKDKF